MASDPISADPEDPATAHRLRDFFSGGEAPRLEDRPPPSGPPVFDVGRAEPAAPDSASVQDVAGLVRYLDAQLELTRRRTAEHVDRALGAVEVRLAALDERLAALDEARAGDPTAAASLVAFRNELFAWLEGYASWEAARFAELDQGPFDDGLPRPPAL